VLRAGDELMQISPTDSDMVIEAKVNPADIGQLHTGLPVSIKFDAFDYSTYGTLQGVLNYISSDTLNETSPTGASSSYYRVHVQLAPTAAHAKIRTDMLKHGMTASIDIQTRSRSIMSYLTKPLHKTFGGALNER
jgi:adhesin transport system membrane fusion protein